METSNNQAEDLTRPGFITPSTFHFDSLMPVFVPSQNQVRVCCLLDMPISFANLL
jgi:hypothetical protein